jgi:hypothetical protein
MRSSAFAVTVNGQPVGVAHAAASYDFVNFDVTGPMDVTITAAMPGFWSKGVDIQPWRLGIRPTRQGQTIRFRLDGPAKLSISRPRDFLNHAQMLFLFAGTPPPPPPTGPNVHIVPAGVLHESLNPKSGDTYYLAPGAYVFGSLNLWKVENVKVLGRGTIVYEGTQDPNTDEGWMQKPDWHCIGSFESKNVEIDGLTCIIRARTWSIQMKDSTGLKFDDLRVIGGNPGNANQDGMDWIGSGDSVVNNAFIRASDDDFALMGNWDGYKEEDMLRPGRDVQNILVEHSEVSTSISNVVRAGWPRKIFNSRNFTLRDSDILHGGIGGCGQTFGLLGFWGAQGSKGDHSNYTFQNLFLDDWYSLVQMEQEQPTLHGFTFRNIWALDQPPLADSTLTGQIAGITFDNVKYGQTRASNNADLPLVVSGGAEAPQFISAHNPSAAFTVDPPVFAPGKKSPLPRRTRPERAIPGCLETEPRRAAAVYATAFPTPKAPSLTEQQTALVTSGFCCTLRTQRPSPTRPARTGRAREWSLWPSGTMPAPRPAPRCLVLPGKSIPENGPNCRTWQLSTRFSPASRPTSALTPRVLRTTPSPGTASSTFPPTADTHSICLLATARGLSSTAWKWPKPARHLPRSADWRAMRCATIAVRWGCAPASIRFILKACTPPARARPACSGKARLCRLPMCHQPPTPTPVRMR